MKEILNPVARIKHIALDQILTYGYSAIFTAVFTYSDFTEIPFVKASSKFNFNKVEADAGKLWTTNLSVNLKSELPALKLGVVLLELESGEQYLIGDTQLPVKDLSVPESLMQKQLSIVHKSWHKPLKIVV